jgi:hypothetical protein
MLVGVTVILYFLKILSGSLLLLGFSLRPIVRSQLTSLILSADVWGFDKNAVDVLQKMRPVDEFLNHRYAILLENGGYMPEAETDVSILMLYFCPHASHFHCISKKLHCA